MPRRLPRRAARPPGSCLRPYVNLTGLMLAGRRNQTDRPSNVHLDMLHPCFDAHISRSAVGPLSVVAIRTPSRYTPCQPSG